MTKAHWRKFIKENKIKYKMKLNTSRLSVDEMSIEQTHLILMVNGPESIEFNIDKDKRVLYRTVPQFIRLISKANAAAICPGYPQTADTD